MATTDATGAGLVEHWSWAAKKGLMNRNTAGALRAASAQVLAVEDDWESLDVRALDVDLILQRFETLRRTDFTPKSLRQYESRFRRAVSSYLKYLENPQSWRYESRDSKTKQEARPKQKGQPVPSLAETQGLGEMIAYPFPVRPGVVARLSLPRDLKRAEARRLASFLESLALDEPRELPSGD